MPVQRKIKFLIERFLSLVTVNSSMYFLFINNVNVDYPNTEYESKRVIFTT